MSRTFTITPRNVLAATHTVFEHIKRGLEVGNVVVTLDREKRSNDQNSLLWALLADVSEQVVWHGQKINPEGWKHILSAAWKQQTTYPGIGGGIVMFGQSTSKLSKKNFSDLIEVIYWFGAEQGVRWSAPSMAIFETYREAQEK